MLSSLLIVLLGASPYFPNGLEPIDAGAPVSAAECRACHADVAADWQHSRHALAWTNGTFQREYRSRPLAWCVHCHAPLQQQVAAVAAGRVAGDGSSADEGVSCAACHLRQGRMHAQRRRVGSPHDSVEVPGFGDAAFCGGCHQFNFPVIEADATVRRYSPHPMQATVQQYDTGPIAGIEGACRGCHAAGAAGHAYPGAHDVGMLRRALDLEVCRLAPARLRLRLANVGAGHHVPSGDVHRHVTLRLWRPSAPAELFDAFIGRRFEPDERGGKRTIWDSTLPPGEARDYDVDLMRLGGDLGEPLSLELRYVYAAQEFPGPGRDAGEPSFSVIERRDLMAQRLPECRPRQAALETP